MLNKIVSANTKFTCYKNRLCIGYGLVIFTIQPCFAQPFFVGSKASGMAGAYVAVENNNTVLLQIPIAIDLIATHDIVKELDDVEQVFYDKNSTPEQFLKEMNDLRKEKMGLVANAYGGISLAYTNFGLSFLESMQAAGNPCFKKIDEYSEEPYLQIKYINMQEYVFSYAQEITNNLHLGTNLKVLVGKLAYAMPKAYERDVEDKIEATLKGEQAKTTTKLGLDIGLLYNKSDKLNYGLVIKNLNSPEFSFPTQTLIEDYQLKRQFRAGVSFKPNQSVILAADCDITKNDTLIQGYQSQNLSCGIEYPLYNPYLVLRGGLTKNLVEDDIGNVYTLGFGLNILYLQADIAAGISGKKTQRSKTGDEYPVNLIGSAQLSWIF